MTTEVKTDDHPAPKANPFRQGFLLVLGGLAALIVVGLLIHLFSGLSIRFRWYPDASIGASSQPGIPSTLPSVGSKENGWTNNGQNALCQGKPKFSPFTCVSPSTGKSTTCFCD